MLPVNLQHGMYHQPVTSTALGNEIDIFLAAWGAQVEIMMLACAWHKF